MEKKGQAWGFDLIAASFIFIGGILLFYTYSINLSDETEDLIAGMNYEGSAIAESLLSEGIPSAWNASNVERIGLLDSGKINDEKLSNFYQLSIDDYQKTRSLFNTKYNYYISLEVNMSINSLEIEGIGSRALSPKNLLRITRLTIYKNKPVILNVDIWK